MTTDATADEDLDRRVMANQHRLAADLQQSYDFIVCGAGSSGCVVARRLAEDGAARVLLLEAGGSDDVPNVTDAALWPTNLGGERDWAFRAEANPNLHGRALTLSMGKVLGGGSSINVMTWARGHRTDWDYFASESGNAAWGHESVWDLYRRIEDWHGEGPSGDRGRGGPVFIEHSSSVNPASHAAVEAAEVLGIASFENPNGKMMEGRGGAALADNCIRNGDRQSIFRAYTYPFMDRPNLTVLTHAMVRRVIFDRTRATGVEVSLWGSVRQFIASTEVILALGAVNTPKVLMLSGVGDQRSLRPLGLPVVAHLRGVGHNLQTHLGFSCVWETADRWPQDAVAAAVMYWSAGGDGEVPDCFACHAAAPLTSPENIERYGMPESCWSIYGALTHPKSRGTVDLTGPGPDDRVRIIENGLSHPEDLTLALKCVTGMREVGNSAAVRPFLKREVMPGNVNDGDGFTEYLRDAAMPFWHQVGTARMGRDPLAVVDGSLRVHGIEHLRVADASVMPRVTAGNTMAPCVVIGERAAEEIKSDYGSPRRHDGGPRHLPTTGERS